MKYIKTLSRITNIIDKKLKQLSIIKLKLLSEIAELEQQNTQMILQIKTENDLLMQNLQIRHTHDFHNFFSSMENKLKQISAEITKRQDELHRLLDEMHGLFIDQKRYELIIANAKQAIENKEKSNEIQILDDINMRKYISKLKVSF